VTHEKQNTHNTKSTTKANTNRYTSMSLNFSSRIMVTNYHKIKK